MKTSPFGGVFFLRYRLEIRLNKPGFRGGDLSRDFDPSIIGRYPSSKMKVREILERLHQDGWYLVTTRGSHRQLKHPTKSGRVTVAGKPSDDLPPGTLNSILKQSGLKK
jgi:predicted RNA binding protein YcfA (HicA-like mRNA interferase family)